MPISSSAELPIHPADLVVDVYGTFLGKRSERMVVRWREGRGSRDEGQGPEAGPGARAHVVRFPGGGTEDSRREADGRRQQVESGGREGEGATCDDAAGVAAGRLMTLWRDDPVALPGPRPSPAERLARQLDVLAEDGADDAAGHPPLPPLSEGGNQSGDRDHAPSDNAPPLGKGGPGGVARDEDREQSSVRMRDTISGGRGGEWLERMVPLCRLRSVTVAGRGITISTDLIAALVERGIGLSFLTGRGQPVAQLSSPGLGGTVQTRRSQLAAYDNPLGVELAVAFVRGKLRNQKHQLQYSGKYLKAADPERFGRLERKIASIANIRRRLADFTGRDLDSVRDALMGFEGTGGRLYWEGVAIVLEGRVEFPGRRTRGAVDPVNAALNYGYGILYSQVSAAIVNAGLELFAGFLHVDRPGKPSLVLDLVEEFRAPVVDRCVLAMINQGILLETDEHGLKASTRRLIGDRILERLSTPVPYEGKRWPLSNVIQNQARHLAVAVRGERVYRPFASRW